MDKERFGPLLERIRSARNLTIRSFCRLASADPARISRLEREVDPPPQDRKILEKYSKALGLQEGSDERRLLFAASGNQEIVPRRTLNDDELLKVLPAFPRTRRGARLTKEEMARLAEKLRREL